MMENFILAGLLALSTSALLSSPLRKVRPLSLCMWGLFVLEITLLAALLFFITESALQPWLPSALVVLAGFNVVLWAFAVARSLGGSDPNASQQQPESPERN
jgi:hypothetical protein